MEKSWSNGLQIRSLWLCVDFRLEGIHKVHSQLGFQRMQSYISLTNRGNGDKSCTSWLWRGHVQICQGVNFQPNLEMS